MDGEFLLIAQLLYGTGLRILEAMRMRVKDVDFTRNTTLVGEAKGNKDRAVMLPTRIVASLQSQLVRANALSARDRTAARSGVHHAGVKTTMIYTYVLKVGGDGVINPLDWM